MIRRLAILGPILVTVASSACSVHDDDDGGADTSTTESEPVPTHGFIRLELRRGESQASDPFVGTGYVLAKLRYGECIAEFYRNNPEWEDDGSIGAPIFGDGDDGGEGWIDRLCAPGEEFAPCMVTSLEQSSDELSVFYVIGGPLEGRQLRFGPLPTAETTGCEPIIEFDYLAGLDADADTLWKPETFSPAETVTDAGGPIRIGAAPAQ